MNIYELNYLTNTNILLYHEESALLIFGKLLNDNIHDALIVYNVYKWKQIFCNNGAFLQLIKQNNIILELTEPSIKELMRNGDKEVLDYADPNDYVHDFILSNHTFIYFILHHYTIHIRSYDLILLAKHTHPDKYNMFMSVLTFYDATPRDIIECLPYLTDDTYLVIHLLSLYPTIQTKFSNKLFHNALACNNLELAVYILSISNALLDNDFRLNDMFRNNCLNTLKWLYNKHAFDGLNHNQVSDIIVSNTIDIHLVEWYLSMFRKHIDDTKYHSMVALLIKKGYVVKGYSYNLTDNIFIDACMLGHLYVVTHFLPADKNVIACGLYKASLHGFIDIVEYLSNHIDTGVLYKVLHNLIEHNSEHIHIIKCLCSKLTFYPPRLMHHLCKMGDIEWIVRLEIDDECIFNTCLYGHFNTFYFLYMNDYVEQYHISDAFIYSCENGTGLFIAKWLYYSNYISKQTIYKSFYNSTDVNTLQWLYKIHPPPIRNNNAYFIECCLNKDIDILNWLCSIFPNYSYENINDHIIPKIDLFIINKPFEQKDCTICFETNSNALTLCNHSFCYDCINTWYKHVPNCPMCRTPINEAYVYSTVTTLAKLRGVSGLYPRDTDSS